MNVHETANHSAVQHGAKTQDVTHDDLHLSSSRIKEDGAVIELHSYASGENTQETVQTMLREALPFVHIKEILHKEVVSGQNSECHATLSAANLPSNVHIAGDWTVEDAFLMEDAVLSGQRTARRVLEHNTA